MARRYNRLKFNMTSGVQTGQERTQRNPRSLADLRNGRFDEAGAINKRFGYTPYGESLSNDIRSMFSSSGVTAVDVTGSSFHVTGRGSRSTGDVALASVETITLVTQQIPYENINTVATNVQPVPAKSGVLSTDFAVGDDTILVVWSTRLEYDDSSVVFRKLHWRLFNKHTYSPITDVMVESSATYDCVLAKCVWVGSKYHVFTKNDGGEITMYVIDPIAGTSGGEVVVEVNGLPSLSGDYETQNLTACAGKYQGTWYSYLHYQDATTSTSIERKRYQADGTLDGSATMNVFTEENDFINCVFADDLEAPILASVSNNGSHGLRFVYQSGNGTGVTDSYDVAMPTSGYKTPPSMYYKDGRVSVCAGTVQSSEYGFAMLDYDPAADTVTFLDMTVTDASTIRDGYAIRTHSYRLVSDSYLDSAGKTWSWFHYNSLYDGAATASETTDHYVSHFLVREGPRVGAVINPGTAHSINGGDNEYVSRFLPRTHELEQDVFATLLISSDSDTLGQTVSLVVASVNSKAKVVSAKNGDVTSVGAGMHMECSGGKLVEGSPLAPAPQLADSTQAGSLTGVYSKKAIRRSKMPNGDFLISAESPATSHTLSSENTLDTVNQMWMSYLRDRTVAIRYLTDPTTGLFYETMMSPEDSDAVIIINDSVDTERAQPYYADGEVQATNPGPIKCIASSPTRLWASDGSRIYYTKLKERGIQPAFSDSLFIDTHGVGGGVTGLGALGDTAVVLRESAVYVIHGEGPNNLGQGYFSDPRLIHPSLGCKDPRSVVQLPQGVIWQSDRGFYMLATNYQIIYIGDAVEAYNDVEVVSAWAVPGTNECRFLTKDDIQLVFDYEHGQWTIDDFGGASAVVDGNDYYRASGKLVLREDSEAYHDNGDFYPLIVETNWLKLGELSADVKWGRFYLNGRQLQDDDVKIRVEVAYNFNDDWEQVIDKTISEGNDRFWRFKHRVSRFKASAIKFRITELEPSGRGFSLTELGMEYAIRPGAVKLPPVVTLGE